MRRLLGILFVFSLGLLLSSGAYSSVPIKLDKGIDIGCDHSCDILAVNQTTFTYENVARVNEVGKQLVKTNTINKLRTKPLNVNILYIEGRFGDALLHNPRYTYNKYNINNTKWSNTLNNYTELISITSRIGTSSGGMPYSSNVYST